MFTRAAVLLLALATPAAFAAKGPKARDKDDDHPVRAAPKSVPRGNPNPKSETRRAPPPPRNDGESRRARVQGNASHGSSGRSVSSSSSSSNSSSTSNGSGWSHGASNPSNVPPAATGNGNNNNGGRVHAATPVGTPSYDPGYDDDNDRRRRHRDRGHHHAHGCGHIYSGGTWVYVDDGRPYYDDYVYGGTTTSYGYVPVFDPNRIPSTDLGVGLGFNAPAGGLGAELEFRPFPFLGLGVHGGFGAWGTRVSPVARLYPAGVRAGVFAEGAITINEGGTSELFGDEREVHMFETAAVSAAIGWRQSWMQHVFTSVKVGYQWPVQSGANYAASAPLNDGERMMMDVLSPGGVVVGATVGVSFF